MKRGLKIIYFLIFISPWQILAQQADSYFNDGKTLYTAGKYEEAVPKFKKYIEMQPGEMSGYHWLGWTFYHLAEFNEAIENLNKANTIQEFWETYLGLGECYYALQDFETSLKHYLKCAELHPHNTEAWLPHNKLGWNYYYLQMYYDAVEQFKQSIKIKPATYSYIGLAKTYSELGEYEKSREILNTTLNQTESEDTKREIKFLLGYNHVAEGRYDEAFKVFGRKNTLGIEIRSVRDGEKIVIVSKNGPAGLAGLKPGDVIVEFAGIPLQGKSTQDFVSTVIPIPAFGSKVNLKVYRDGYVDDKFLYVGISPDIYNLALNDADLIGQREQAGAAKVKEKLNVAVVELATAGLSPDEAAALTARVRSELFNTSKFNVLERDEMSTILNEQSLQQTGITSDERLVQAGKLLNVKYIVGGSISKIGQYFSITLKLIEVETGKIKAMPTEDIQGGIEEVLVSGIKRAVQKLVQ